jgi:hypothetical protein
MDFIEFNIDFLMSSSSMVPGAWYVTDIKGLYTFAGQDSLCSRLEEQASANSSVAF